MKVEKLKKDTIPSHAVEMAGCFNHGCSVYMRISGDPDTFKRGYITAVNLESGEVTSIDKRTLVYPIAIVATEVSNAKS